MSPLAWSGIVWGGWLALFGVLELLAHSRLVPWLTLSSFTWSLEDLWPPFAYAVIAGFAVLVGHLVVAKFH